jgi:transporter family protein
MKPDCSGSNLRGRPPTLAPCGLAYNLGMQLSWFYNALLSAVFAGATAVLAKVGLAGVNPDLATLVRTAFVLAFLMAIYLALHGVPSLTVLSGRAFTFLALSALSTALSWLFYYRAIQSGPVAAVAAIDKGSIIVTAVLAAVLLGEALTVRVVVGAVIVSAGLWLMTTRPIP